MQSHLIVPIASLLLVAAAAEAATRDDRPLERLPAEARQPIAFIANHGQVSGEASFYVKRRQATVFVGPRGLTYVARAGAVSSSLAMVFEGASACTVVGEERLPGVVSSFVGVDPTRWHAGVPTFGAVRWRGVWPGIDVVAHGRGGELEYDVVLAPHADPAAVRLRYDGAARVALGPDGGLVVATAAGPLHERPPVAYQEVAGRRVSVPARFVVSGSSVGFAVGAYDRRRPLVIDPVAWATYLGGSDYDEARAVVTDASGNVYVAGSTASSDFPVKTSLLPSSGNDAFVSKLDPVGWTILLSTYYGGAGFDEGTGLAVDPAGVIYLAGTAGSNDLPVLGAFQGANAGGRDGFVAKISPGGALLFASYLGGTGDDDIAALALAMSSSTTVLGMVVAGTTRSADFPLERPAQSALGGGSDAFVAHISSARILTYSTYLGGAGDDDGRGVSTAGGGEVIVVGETRSADFPRVCPIDATLGGVSDAFVARVSTTATTSLLFSSFLGGSKNDWANDVVALGTSYPTVVLVGGTRSDDFPVVGVPMMLRRGGLDGFATRLVPAPRMPCPGYSVDRSIYIQGGDFEDEAKAVAVVTTEQGPRTWVAGETWSPDFHTNDGGASVYGGSGDGFVLALTPAWAIWRSSFVGGDSDDAIEAIAVRYGSPDSAVLAGWTFSSGLASSLAADKTVENGDGWVLRVSY